MALQMPLSIDDDRLKRIKLIPLIELSREDQRRILQIRNQRSVRDNMYTNHEISDVEHFRWVDSLRTTTQNRFFTVWEDNEIVGGVSLNAINKANRRADWAFYLDERKQKRGLGSTLEFKFLDFVFIEENFQKLNCEVLEFNTAVIALHKRFGFREEGFRRNHILRDNKVIGAYLLGITKEEWMTRRDMIAFNQQPGQHDPSYYMKVIDDIEHARSKNNRNWMDLLRLSFQKAPNETAAIVSEIYKEDQAIAAMAKKLVPSRP